MTGIFGNSLGLTRESAASAPAPAALPVGTPADFVNEMRPLVAATKYVRDVVYRGIVSFEQSMTAPLPWYKAAYAAYLFQVSGRALQGMGGAIQGALVRRAGSTHPDLLSGAQAAASLIASLKAANPTLRLFL